MAIATLDRMEREKQLLLLCCKQVEQMLNWGDSEAWTNEDFEQLSEKIFEKTRVQLSISTLKRIWGKVRYDNFPATATLNALVAFLDYESWREFRQKNDPDCASKSVNKETEEITSIPAQPDIETAKVRRSKAGRVLVPVGLLLIVTAIVFAGRGKKPVNVDPSKIKFEAIKVSNTLPNSVIFNYDASAFHSDSVYIQQSWDPRRREQVDGNAKQHTSVYYNPGYFLAKLIVDGQIKKECVVNIQTKGWKGIIEKDPIPTYLSVTESHNDGYLGISPVTLQQKTGSPVFNNVWVKFANIRSFATIDPDNFTFETNVRNTSAVEASVCRRVNVILLLKNSAVILPICDKGCISEINLLTGEAWVTGKDHDLSAFGCDFSNFQNLKLTVKNRDFTVCLNSKHIFQVTLKNKLPEVVGIRFEFEGSGEVKDVKLTTPGAGNYIDSFIK
jgi:hypothetical protein